MRLILAAVVLATFVLALGCSKGPDPDRLKTPSQLASVDSCEDVRDVMKAMDDHTLWSPDLSFDERLLVFDRDHDSIKSLHQFYCGPGFKECRHASRFIDEYVPEFMAPSMFIYFLLAEDFLDSDCY